MNTTEQDTRLAEIGRASMESIREMVDACDREKAAHRYARDLTREQCVSILTDLCGIECRDEEAIEKLREAVAVNVEDSTCEPPDFEFDEESARERIQEDPLSVEVRADWFTPGSSDGRAEPVEFKILLGTGGPAVRIIGELGRYNEPESARLQTQDWFTPWTDYRGDSDDDEALLTYCRNFYFGE